MSFHLMTYQGTVNAASYTKVNSINDPAMPTYNNNYTPPQDYHALFAFSMGATQTAARIASPTISKNYPPSIRPILASNAVPSDPNLCILLESPLRLPQYEGIEIDVINGGSEATYACIGATQQIVPAAKGELKVLRGTATTTLTANQYTTLSVTWDYTLAQGTYDVVSAEVYSATGRFFRLIFPGQTDRPGGICLNAVGNRSNLYFTARFALGQWLTFPYTIMPQVEVMATGADAAQTVFLYIVQRS